MLIIPIIYFSKFLALKNLTYSLKKGKMLVFIAKSLQTFKDNREGGTSILSVLLDEAMSIGGDCCVFLRTRNDVELWDE